MNRLAALILDHLPYRREGAPFVPGGEEKDWIGYLPRFREAEMNGGLVNTPVIEGGPETPFNELTDEDIALLLTPLPDRF